MIRRGRDLCQFLREGRTIFELIIFWEICQVCVLHLLLEGKGLKYPWEVFYSSLSDVHVGKEEIPITTAHQGSISEQLQHFCHE
jgi:hypothetical protein